MKLYILALSLSFSLYLPESVCLTFFCRRQCRHVCCDGSRAYHHYNRMPRPSTCVSSYKETFLVALLPLHAFLIRKADRIFFHRSCYAAVVRSRSTALTGTTSPRYTFAASLLFVSGSFLIHIIAGDVCSQLRSDAMALSLVLYFYTMYKSIQPNFQTDISWKKSAISPLEFHSSLSQPPQHASLCHCYHGRRRAMHRLTRRPVPCYVPAMSDAAAAAESAAPSEPPRRAAVQRVRLALPGSFIKCFGWL